MHGGQSNTLVLFVGGVLCVSDFSEEVLYSLTSFACNGGPLEDSHRMPPSCDSAKCINLVFLKLC